MIVVKVTIQQFNLKRTLVGCFSNTQSYGILMQALGDGQTSQLKLTGSGDEIRLQFIATKNDTKFNYCSFLLYILKN